jgi:hypothetical protein
MCEEVWQSAIGLCRGTIFSETRIRFRIMSEGRGLLRIPLERSTPPAEGRRCRSPKKDGAPVPGSPGLQAISFNTSCEIEIARNLMQAAGQVRERRSGGESGRSNGDFAPPRLWGSGSARTSSCLMSARRAQPDYFAGRWGGNRRPIANGARRMRINRGEQAALPLVSSSAIAKSQNGVRLRMAAASVPSSR